MVKDQKFLDMVAAGIRERMVQSVDVWMERILKNNGAVRTGVAIGKNGSAVSQVVYLENYYHEFCEGKGMTEIIEEICSNLSELSEEVEALLPDFTDFSALRDRVVFRLINREANREMLENMPYVEVCDLAAVIWIFVENEAGEMLGNLVRRELMDFWKISADDLFQAALENTPRLLPARLQTLHSVLKEMMDGKLKEEMAEGWEDAMFPPETKECYVLSNTRLAYGAAAVLYPDCLQEAAEKMASDLVVIPSSLHEVLLMAYDEETDLDALRRMVCEVNKTCVSVEERLSDQVYLYRRKVGRLELAEK